jgi:hypothetical protein
MSGLTARAFHSTNHSMGSNAYTVINQGGGDKKAGFPYQVGRSWQTSITLGAVDPVHGKCCRLDNWNTTIFPLARQSRPIGSGLRNVPYWQIPGTKA